jgi:hypothetical protein
MRSDIILNDSSNNEDLVNIGFVNVDAPVLLVNFRDWKSNYAAFNLRFSQIAALEDWTLNENACDLSEATARFITPKVGNVISWLKYNSGLSVRHFNDMADVITGAGLDSSSVSVAQSKFIASAWRQELDSDDTISFFDKITEEASYATFLLFGLIVDYGHRPLKVVYFIVLLTAATGVIILCFDRGGSYDIKVDTYSRLDRNGINMGKVVTKRIYMRGPYVFFYALDTFIPFIVLRPVHYRFELDSKIARRWLYVHKFAGYVLSAFLLAGIGGLTP